MNDVTLLLHSIDQGEAKPEDLLPVVYEQLRKMAAKRMAGERAGHTLQATALVHEAWMRLRGSNELGWQNRAHFFGAAAEAMRRILVDHARKKRSEKRGGGLQPVELTEESNVELDVPSEELLAVNEALKQLVKEDSRAAELVKLRYFVGLTMEETAEAMGHEKAHRRGDLDVCPALAETIHFEFVIGRIALLSVRKCLTHDESEMLIFDINMGRSEVTLTRRCSAEKKLCGHSAGPAHFQLTDSSLIASDGPVPLSPIPNRSH